jgi:hypothetical protein
MKVTGYELKEAIKMAQLELATVRTQYDETLYAFEGEEKPTPQEIMGQIEDLEDRIANLQSAQSAYNLQVKLDFQGNEITLGQAIRLVGGRGRISKMWRDAAQGQVRDRWDRKRQVTRNKDEEVAQPTMDRLEALKLAKDAEQAASRLRSLIAQGNANTVEIEGLDPKLLEISG